MVAPFLLTAILAANFNATSCTAELERQLRDGLFTGAAVARCGEAPIFIGRQGATAADLSVTAATRFEIASVTKTITAAVCASLYAEGKLDPERPFTHYLPEHVLAKEKCAITVRDLAVHASGFAYYGLRRYSPDPKVNGGKAGYLADIYALRPTLPYGKFSYSCYNYVLLGLIAERLGGKPLAELARERIFKPLGMSNTSWWPVKDDGHVVRTPLVQEDGRKRKIGEVLDPPAFYAGMPVGNAGIYSTLGDMLKFVQDLRDRRHFAPKYYALLSTPTFDRDGERRSFGFDMGSTWRPAGFSKKAFFHSGFTGQTIIVDPGTGFAGVVLTVRSGDWAQAFEGRKRILSIMAGSEGAGPVLTAYDPLKATDRPPVGERLFTSPALERKIADICARIGEGKLARTFAACYPNTLDTTVHYRRLADGRDDCFVYTGDIHAMWLRDSSAQVQPYLRFAKEDESVKRLVRGVLLRQFEFLRIDPYANAFSIDPNGVTHDDAVGDVCEKPIHRQVFERKYELDSLCYPLRLAYAYWKTTGDTSIFDAGWEQALKGALAVMRDQQRRKGSENTIYGFARRNATNFQTHAPFYGKGMPCRYTGMVGSVYRPSDDGCYYPFLVPSNFFAADVLPKAAEIIDAVKGDARIASECRAIAAEIRSGIEKYAVHEHPIHGKVYCFEVDGFGNGTYMDDANVPSLLALPYIAPSLVKRGDPIYENTRRLVWSDSNPFFYKGKVGEGIGSPHTWYNQLWPMSIIIKALTATDDAEVRQCVEMLLRLDAGRNFMHEGVNCNNPKSFSRPWFSWANTLFGELIAELDASGRLDVVKGL